MRKTGKTTRVIDDAIQKLFIVGKITVPSKSILERDSFYRGRKVNSDVIIVDPDWRISNTVQRDLFERIARRVHVEHSQSVDIDFHKQTFEVKQTIER